ncbi:hypothetical protein RYA05_02285 [Pseudomonas syringae pv. actinidiae]|nr:hypothetical protein [Pseudomonas syringae pv. actinidiae]
MKIGKKFKAGVLEERKMFLREVSRRVRKHSADVILKHKTPISEQLILHVRMAHFKNEPIKVIVSIYRPKSELNRPASHSAMFSARTRDLYKNFSFWVDANRDPDKPRGVKFRRVKKIGEARSFWDELFLDEVEFDLGDLVGPRKFNRMFQTLK